MYILLEGKLRASHQLSQHLYWDRERCELVATKPIPNLNIIEGEVLLDARGYISPSWLTIEKILLKYRRRIRES